MTSSEASGSPEQVPAPKPPIPTNSSTRLLWIAIVILALANLSTLGFLWYQHQCQEEGENCRPPRPEASTPHDEAPHRGAAFDFIVNETKMSEQQIQQYEELRDQHQQAIRPLRNTQHQVRETLFQELNSTDDVKRGAQLQQLAQLHSRQDSITIKHFQQVRNILNPEQQQKFDQIIGEATRMMGGPPPRRE